MLVTRFAPSPTGYLHLGHAYSALDGWLRARQVRGRFLLRMEDIDITRCRPTFDAAVLEDLTWLGLDWDGPIRRQSEHFQDYKTALRKLQDIGVLYTCFCTRKDIAAASSAPHGPDGQIYPGTCRNLPAEVIKQRFAENIPYALRIDITKAQLLTGDLYFEEEDQGSIAAQPQQLGDVVLARREFPCSYHLCVTVDDALQGVTLVTRADDLLPATYIHRLLQALLDLPTPHYAHHPLLTNIDGIRLSKRTGARSLRSFREGGSTPAEIRALAGFPG